jgi:hypothetical protein
MSSSSVGLADIRRGRWLDSLLFSPRSHLLPDPQLFFKWMFAVLNLCLPGDFLIISFVLYYQFGLEFFPKICWINLKIVEDFKKFSKSKFKITKVVFQSKDMDYNRVSLQSLSLDFGFGLDCNCLSFFLYWISIWRLMYSVIEIMINLFQLWWIHFFVENTAFLLERKSFFLKADIPCELLLLFLLLFVVVVVMIFVKESRWLGDLRTTLTDFHRRCRSRLKKNPSSRSLLGSQVLPTYPNEPAWRTVIGDVDQGSNEPILSITPQVPEPAQPSQSIILSCFACWLSPCLLVFSSG